MKPVSFCGVPVSFWCSISPLGLMRIETIMNLLRCTNLIIQECVASAPWG